MIALAIAWFFVLTHLDGARIRVGPFQTTRETLNRALPGSAGSPCVEEQTL